VILGAFFAVLFGAATVYLALRAGVTVSASIPIAVLAIAVFKKVGSTILENNIVQTIGSAGESVAAGVAFTVPAFLFLSTAAGGERFFSYWPIMMLSLAGGFLGVLMMVPLRRALIVQEHANLPYPEGTACAEVLVAGEKGGEMAKMVFNGLWIAMIYKVFNTVLSFFKEVPAFVTSQTAVLRNFTINCEITPEYLGVGYIIGPRVAGIMVSGSILGWMALTPLLSMFVDDQTLHAQLRSLAFSDHWIETHSMAEQFYRGYIRLIGAGAVAMAGLMSLARSMPTIWGAFAGSLKSLKGGLGHQGALKRTEHDLPIGFVAVGSVILALVIAFGMPGLPTHGLGSLALAVLIIGFGFFFVTVSSRIVGLIGTTSNPISGMTIATLMGTCFFFLMCGWTGDPLPDRRGDRRCHRGGCRRQRRRHLAGPQDRLHRRRHTAPAADRPDHRSHRVGLRHRRHAVPPAPFRLRADRLRQAAGAAADIDRDPGEGDPGLAICSGPSSWSARRWR